MTAATSAATLDRRLDRDSAVRRFGQPSRTWGSVNEPRHREADGVKHNEMWVYKSPRDLSSEWAERVLYWLRYDLVASVRVHRDGRREQEDLTP
jgi:hypothetical protein